MGSRPTKRITVQEKEWVKLMSESGLGPIEAARKVFGWRCEPSSSQARKAVNLKKAERIQKYTSEVEEKITRETEVQGLFMRTDEIEWDKLRRYSFDRLEHIRDDPNQRAQVRYNALQALKKLSDPAKDTGLINMWLNILWRGAEAHCPCCHNTFPIHKIRNKNLDAIWEANGPPKDVSGILERRMEIISRSDPRKEPHDSQIPALQSPERHIAGKGAARGGKSLLLAWMALMFFLIPGVEVWILSRVYQDSKSEVEYLRRFLNTLFFPYADKLVKEVYDTRTSELIMTSKWGSELRVMSGKSKGSITGRELEAAFVAEPGWVAGDLYEELRARMSSRLGRIIMFGTPKGFGGILGRLLNARGTDPKTGRIIRIPPEKRTIAAGASWGTSLLSYNLIPSDNPEYVKSELDSARMELLDEEYASEFEGIMTLQEGAKFPNVKAQHLRNIDISFYENCVFVLGIDQGPKNFAATLLAYNGKTVVASKEYFETDNMTMKHHMGILKNSVPAWIQNLGGHHDAWKLTIFDVDPPLLNELNEFEQEGSPWPTPVTFRPKNMRGQYNQQNWRVETYEYLNILASKTNPTILWNLQECQMLHDQVMQVQNRPANPDKDDVALSNKHWIVNDPWRGDHVLDAMVLALWTILSHQLEKTSSSDSPVGDPWSEHKAAFDYTRRVEEARELSGFQQTPKKEEIFRDEFGREGPRSKSFFGRGISPYKDY